MTRPIAVALPFLFVSAIAAQEPASPASPAPQPNPRTPGVTAQQPTTTLTGCLYREDQVPGRKPNVAERAGVLEDYILAGVSAGAGTSAKPEATPGATGTSGRVPSTGTMYKVEGPSDEKLKALVGKKVEVTGRIDPEGGPGATSTGAPRPDRGPGPDRINLPEFEAASIREVSGSCPATPEPPK
jgi:hypothetical protein